MIKNIAQGLVEGIIESVVGIGTIVTLRKIIEKKIRESK